MKNSFCLIAVLPLLLFSQVLAASNPSVLEEVIEYEWGDTRISYTVDNPVDSTIGDVVGFVIEVAHPFDFSLWAYTENGWRAQGMTSSLLNSTAWDSKMKANYSSDCALTWKQFFGGINYPFGDVIGVGYFVNYSQIATNTFKFDWSFAGTPDHLPILPGETRGGFYTSLDGTASQYLLAYIGNAQNDTFSSSGLTPFRGNTVPEPATMLLLGFGGLLLRRRSV